MFRLFISLHRFFFFVHSHANFWVPFVQGHRRHRSPFSLSGLLRRCLQGSISVSIALGLSLFLLISYSDIMCFRLSFKMHAKGLRILPLGDRGGGNLEAFGGPEAKKTWWGCELWGDFPGTQYFCPFLFRCLMMHAENPVYPLFFFFFRPSLLRMLWDYLICCAWLPQLPCMFAYDESFLRLFVLVWKLVWESFDDVVVGPVMKVFWGPCGLVMMFGFLGLTVQILASVSVLASTYWVWNVCWKWRQVRLNTWTYGPLFKAQTGYGYCWIV